MKYRIDKYDFKGNFVSEGGIIYNKIEDAKNAYLNLDKISQAKSGFLYRITSIEECDFCEKGEFLAKRDSQRLAVFVSKDKQSGFIRIVHEIGLVDDIRIVHCPMCGRKFNENK